ncbi:MAG: hypothetical protein WBW85_15555 [Terriglobales bacterium]
MSYGRIAEKLRLCIITETECFAQPRCVAHTKQISDTSANIVLERNAALVAATDDGEPELISELVSKSGCFTSVKVSGRAQNLPAVAFSLYMLAML